MKKVIFIPVLFSMASMVLAHEFWLQPMRFLLKVGEQTTVSIFVGEDYKGESADGRKYKIFKLSHYAANGESDFKENVHDSNFSKITASFSQAGNHLLAFNNTNKFIELEAVKFNNYLASEGLDDAANWRKQQGDTAKPGREFYQRCVKTLFQVGKAQDNSYAVNTGMRLELIPRTNPYAIAKTGTLTYKVLFDNKPLSNALVLAWNVANEKTSVKKYRSNHAGEVTFAVTARGRWMISTVHMVRHTNPTEADWQSYWASYTFGYY